MPVDKLIVVWLPIALGIVMIAAGAVNFVAPGSVRSLSFTPASSRPPRWRKILSSGAGKSALRSKASGSLRMKFPNVSMSRFRLRVG